MINSNDSLYSDFERIQQIPIIPMMLEVICQTTGMGFAAIARVTEDRWLACSVRDEIQFGLKAGGELKVETTICNEIRTSHQQVIIDHVAEDADFCGHHTPAMYGFQSYASFPIFLKNGDFFGTLCAIDPRPAQLNNTKIICTFTMFTDLIAFHLQSLELLEQSKATLQHTTRELDYIRDENLQYEKISSHNIAEQLRKISVFSDILVNHTGSEDFGKMKRAAKKINSFVEELSDMFEHVIAFSGLRSKHLKFEDVDLKITIIEVISQLRSVLPDTKIALLGHFIPRIRAVPEQMTTLFSELLQHLAGLTVEGQAHSMTIEMRSGPREDHKELVPGATYCELVIEADNVDHQQLQNIFDLFVHSNKNQHAGRYGTGLGYCRKIVHNHSGFIQAKALVPTGIMLSILFPVTADN